MSNTTLREKYADIRDRLKAAGLKPISSRSGCKVSWETYATKEEAEQRAVFAREEAVLCAQEGYDFGYLTPGTVEQVSWLDNGISYTGYEVVLP